MTDSAAFDEDMGSSMMDDGMEVDDSNWHLGEGGDLVLERVVVHGDFFNSKNQNPFPPHCCLMAWWRGFHGHDPLTSFSCGVFLFFCRV